MPDEPDPAAEQPGWAAPGGASREPDADGAPPEATVPSPPAPMEPAPFSPPPGGEPTRRSKAWLVTLLAVLGVALLAAIGGTILFVDRTLPPYDAAEDFLHDLVRNRRAEAAAQLCERDRANADAVLERVARTFFGHDGLVVNALGVDRDGSTATVEYNVDIDRDDDNVDNITHELPLVEEDGEWRPCPGGGTLR